MAKKLSKSDINLADFIKSASIVLGVANAMTVAYGAIKIAYKIKENDEEGSSQFYPALLENSIYGTLFFAWRGMMQSWPENEVFSFLEDNLTDDEYSDFLKVDEIMKNIKKDADAK
jgi:hypothetical protein